MFRIIVGGHILLTVVDKLEDRLSSNARARCNPRHPIKNDGCLS
jgi:hypothetical protein